MIKSEFLITARMVWPVSSDKWKAPYTRAKKLTLANSQHAIDFDNLQVRKTSTSKRLRVGIIHVSQTKGKNLLVVSPVC